MKTQPAVFLKLLVLLVPRQMEIEHSGGLKQMSDEQLEQGIAAIQEMLAQREAGSGAKVIEALPESSQRLGDIGASRGASGAHQAQGVGQGTASPPGTPTPCRSASDQATDHRQG